MTRELAPLAARHGIRPDSSDTVGAAASRLGTTPRMLRYRETLGLVSPPRTAGGYRTYREPDLLAAALAADLEHRYGVPPAALAFGLRVLSDPEVAEQLRALARLARRPAPPQIAALDFETRKGLRLLRLAG